MKIKIFGGINISTIEEKINEFIQNKRVIDIKVAQGPVSGYTRQGEGINLIPAITIAVLYEDIE